MVGESDTVTDSTQSEDKKRDFTAAFGQKTHGTKVKQERKSIRMMPTISETANS